MAVLQTKGVLEIPYKGKLFEKPDGKYEVNHTLPTSEEASIDKVLGPAYHKIFAKELKKLSKTRGKEILKAMAATEKSILKKQDMVEAEMKKFVEVANSSIKQGLRSFEFELQRLAEACIEKAYALIEKKIKRKLIRKKVVVALKITGLVLITLAAAAIVIAASAVSGGALGVVIAGAIATGIMALVKSGKIINSEMKSYGSHLAKVTADADKIDKAIAYAEKKATKKNFAKLNPKEKAKLLMAKNSAGTHTKSLKKNLETAEAKIYLVQRKLKGEESTIAEATKNADKLKKEGAGPASTELAKLEKQIAAAEYYSKAFNKDIADFKAAKAAALAALDKLEKTGEWPVGRFGKLFAKFRDHETRINDLTNTFVIMAKSAATVASKLA